MIEFQYTSKFRSIPTATPNDQLNNINILTNNNIINRFPKNPILRQKWLKVCGLSKSDNVSYIYICSEHFNPGDVDKGNNIQARITLRAGAVPSVGVPNLIDSNNENDRFNNEDEVTITTHVFDGNKCTY